MNVNINLSGIKFKNPIITASGTFGSGIEYSKFINLNELGGIITKSVSNIAWEGNNTPRISEIKCGIINSIGLQNEGIEILCKKDIKFLNKYKTKIIINICGKSIKEYCYIVERLSIENIDMIEVNISCPNVKNNCIIFGQNFKMAENIVKEIKKYSKHPIIVKLTPNVTNIVEIAKAVESGGADAISLINTLIGIKIDIKKKNFVLSNKTGGISGPCLKPLALYMVYKVVNSVKIPVIGIGGICNFEDVLEFIFIGANAVEIGTANFFDPYSTIKILHGIKKYMIKNKINNIKSLIGILK